MKTWVHLITRPTLPQDSGHVILPFLISRSPIKEIIYFPHQGKYEAWFPTDQLERYFSQLQRLLFLPSWSAKQHLRDYRVASRRVVQAATSFVRLFQTEKRGDKLADAYSAIPKAWVGVMPFMWTPFMLERQVEPWLQSELGQKFTQTQTMTEVIGALSFVSTRERLYRILLQWKAAGSRKDVLRKYAARYGYFGVYSVNDKPWSPNELYQLVKHERHPDLTLRARRRQFAIHAAQFRQIQFRLKAFPRLVRAAEAIHLYSSLRDERADLLRQFFHDLQVFIRRLEKQEHLPRGAGAFLTVDEMAHYLRGGQMVDREKLRERMAHYPIIHFVHNRSVILTSPKERHKVSSMLYPVSKVSTSIQLKGRGAYFGVVRGRVRRILYARDARTISAGEILVANMTHPDYIYAIKKAAAIVTDEGGLVCHAAIISREMRKPCVIGTKVATKVFKDGDWVEVDATKGIVRRL